METIQKENSSTERVVRLDAALCAEIELYSEKAGESLDSFISRASAELIHRHKADEWYERSRHSTPEGRAKAIELLSRPSGNPPLPGDELPDGHRP